MVDSRLLRPLLALTSTLAFASLLGCAGDAEPPVEAPVVACTSGNEVAGACAGVPQGAVCAGTYCAEGLSCSTVINAADDAAVAAALASAQAGSCVALAPGSYGDISLPGGVSLVGKGASEVQVKSVVVGVGGQGAVVRGITVTGGGIVVNGSDSQIVSSRVDGSSGVGVEVAAGASVKIVQSEVVGSGTYGVRAFDTGAVTVEGSIISGSQGPGIWAQCAAGCDCLAMPQVSITRTILRDNKIIGASLVGVAATVTDVDVRDNSEGANFEASGGVSISGCSTATASGLRVIDNSSFGVLIDNSSATISSTGGGKQGIEVSRNFMGVWVQHVTDTQEVKLDGMTVDKNQAVGLGASGQSRGIICWNSAITGTQKTSIPVLKGGVASAEDVGDGISWLEGSQMALDNITLSANSRASVLINGNTASGSSISNITLSGGDEALGIVQQNVPASPQSPSVGAGAPAITTSGVEKFAVPVGPSVPKAK